MFELIRNLFRPQTEPRTLDAELIGDDLDAALDTYAELLDNSCRDHLVLDVARERIADLQERYHTAKLEHLAGEK